jgi:peroxiredoxin Q/BCP
MSALDAVVVGISHQDVDSHRSFTAHHGLTVPLLADVDHEVGRAYGVAAPVLGTRRAAFILDEDGIVRHRVVHRLGLDFQNADDLAEALDALPSRA